MFLFICLSFWTVCVGGSRSIFQRLSLYAQWALLFIAHLFLDRPYDYRHISIAPNRTHPLTPHLHQAIPKILPHIAITVPNPWDWAMFTARDFAITTKSKENDTVETKTTVETPRASAKSISSWREEGSCGIVCGEWSSKKGFMVRLEYTDCRRCDKHGGSDKAIRILSCVWVIK